MGVGASDRYAHYAGPQLKAEHLYHSVGQAQIFFAFGTDANLVFFQNDDFTGPFAQTSLLSDGLESTLPLGSKVSSAMLIGSAHAGHHERRVSFVQAFKEPWATELSKLIDKTPARPDGDPVLTWEMFPSPVGIGTEKGWVLQPDLTYLRIHQQLNVDVTIYDQAASFDYWVYLYKDNNGRVQASVVQWRAWVDGGIATGRIFDALWPRVVRGATTLEQMVNPELAGLTADIGTISDIYYLPGTQLDPRAQITNLDTRKDVTIVIETTG
jgi:hypothetical protein